MAEPGAATAALLAIARDVGDDRALAGLICRACVDGLKVDGAALSLLTASVARHTLHATDATAEMLEELQFSLNEGACIEAATTGNPVFVDDIRQASEVARWPVFASAVIELTDVRTLCALPLRWGTTNLGVLDLYRRVPAGLSHEQRTDALSAADTAALMMLTLRTEPTGTRATDTGRGTSWLDPMVASRAEIHQATGMVLIQLDTTAADALARLRGYAFAERRLLIDVARDVVARRLDFSGDTP
ncbi:MAG TPA: GAF and ANTAR domain-containing protein [Pseudonocardia sp.]